MLKNVVFGIQCRMGSTRLPGKVLKQLNGKELILHLLECLLNSGVSIKNIYFLIPDTAKDIELERFIKERSINYLVGSETNVYSRYKKLCNKLGEGKIVVRLTGDNPFIDLNVVFATLRSHLNLSADFTSTRLITESGEVIRFVPKGNSVDIFNTDLILGNEVGLSEFDKEHVIPSLYRLTNVNLVKQEYFDFKIKESISIDTKEDFIKLQGIYNES